jgi:hypothetical protein
MFTDTNGVERPAEITTATVDEAKQVALCGVLFDDGQADVRAIPLSDGELAAWRRHPDTFFGVLGQQIKSPSSPLELYDFFHASFTRNSKEQLLKIMADAEDFEWLTALDQPQLASICAERTTNSALAKQRK